MLISLASLASASDARAPLRVASDRPAAIDVQAKQDTPTQDLEREWQSYLKDLGQSDEVTPAISAAVRAFWSDLTARLGRRPEPPVAGPTEQGTFIVVWDHGRHHFEVEFHPTGTIQWFFRDRKTGAYDGAEGSMEVVVNAARDYFNRVQAA